MRAVIQRVKSASVTVDGQIVSSIGPGLLCLIGINERDQLEDADWLAKKILNSRLWPSENKAWDHSVSQQNYEVLCVSQFTLFCRLKGNKPDFSKAMGPQPARDLYGKFLDKLKEQYKPEMIKDGVFGAMMDVELVNCGPVTILLDTENKNGVGGGGGSVASSLDDM